MTICFPYVPLVWNKLDYGWDDEMFVFYQAVDVPELQGGKEPRVCGDTVLDMRGAEEAMKLLGGRFRINANSCFPELTEKAKNLCSMASEYGSGIVVARLDFARRLKDLFPKLALHSSVIMNFYEDIDTILSSELFETVGGSQFNNDDTQKMIDIIPEKNRSKVQYLLLGCVWSRECIAHYEIPSVMWRHPDKFSGFRFKNEDCTGRSGFDVQLERLLEAGFDKFKIGYRTPPVGLTKIYLDKYIARYNEYHK